MEGGGGVLLPGAVLPQVTLHKEGDYTNSATMQLQRVCFQNAASTTDQLLHRIHYTFCHLAELGGRPKLPINAKTKNYCFSYLAYIYKRKTNTVANSTLVVGDFTG